HRDPLAHRSDGRAARQAHDVDLRPVRALQAEGGCGRLAPAARGIRRCGDRHARAVHAEPPGPHPPSPGAHALGPRAGLRPDRGQHLSRRAVARTARLPAPGPRLEPLPHADRPPLDVRLGDPSRRRHHGRPGRALRADDAPRAGGLAMALDAIVIGGGQNGLAAAARLAAAGRKVAVLERRGAVGGLAGAVEIHPGYRVPGILHDEGRVSPRATARLGLERPGLAWRNAPPVFLAETGGPGILVPGAGTAGSSGDGGNGSARRDGGMATAAAGEIGARSRRDAAAWLRYRAFLDKLRPLLDAVM